MRLRDIRTTPIARLVSDCPRNPLADGRWLGRQSFGRAALLGLIAGAGAVAAYTFGVEPEWLEVTRLDVAISGLAPELDGLVIAQLSDFHVGAAVAPKEAAAQAIAVCNDVRPDVVVMTGDYVTRRNAIAPFATLLRRLEVRPAIAVLGNHDYRNGPRHRRALLDAFTELDITLLQNQSFAYARRGATLWFVGVGDGYTSHDRLDEATRGLDDGAPKILLTHYPDALLDYPPDHFALALAGHTHGAQVNLPIVSRIALRKSDTQFSRGLYNVRGTPLYVNRGLGTSSYHARLFARPEVTLITLRRRATEVDAGSGRPR